MVNIYIQDSDAAHLALLVKLCQRCLCQQGHHGRVIETGASLEHILEKSVGTKKESLFIVEYQPTEEFCRLAVKIRRENPSCYILLTVHQPEEVFSPFPIGIRFSRMLRRPVTHQQMESLLDAMETDYFEMRMQSHDRFQFRAQNCDHYLYYPDILYFEAQDKKVTVRTPQQSFEFYDSLAHIERYAPRFFFRTHRSYLVNTKKILQVDYTTKTILMAGGSRVLLARERSRQLRDYLSQ